MKVDIEAARAAVRERVADPLGMTVEAAAAGIIRIANANMERAVRVSSAEKGYDPRDIVLLAFGGAGPLHAAALARAARIPTVLVPPQPGVFSAVGLVMADIRHDFVRSQILRGAEITVSRPLLERYKRTLSSFVDGAREFCTRRGMSYLMTTTETPIDLLVANYLRRRGLVR